MTTINEHPSAEMTAAPEMVERVAQAVAKTLVACGVIRKRANDPWVVGPSILVARAAINAMREPTSRMLAGAVMSAVAGDPTQADYTASGVVLELLPPTDYPDARAVIADIRRDYRAAIDAALGEP